MAPVPQASSPVPHIAAVSTTTTNNNRGWIGEEVKECTNKPSVTRGCYKGLPPQHTPKLVTAATDYSSPLCRIFFSGLNPSPSPIESNQHHKFHNNPCRPSSPPLFSFNPFKSLSKTFLPGFPNRLIFLPKLACHHVRCGL